MASSLLSQDAFRHEIVLCLEPLIYRATLPFLLLQHIHLLLEVLVLFLALQVFKVLLPLLLLVFLIPDTLFAQ